MKQARKASVFLILLLIPLLLAGVLHPAINIEGDVTVSPIPTKVSTPSYDSHDPIVILNDTAFDEMASLESWDGDGSPGTPYIIDSYNITSDGTCIKIRDTVRAFEIRNCYVSSISNSPGIIGIQINNVTQAAIVDTFVLNKYWSIDIVNTPAPYIENCTIHDGYTIYLYKCTGATITGCHIYDNTGNGVYLDTCNSSLISNNEIFGNGGQGLLVEYSDFLTITTNTFAKNVDEGISLEVCNNATIHDNDIWENDFPGSHGGIYIINGHYNLIDVNRIWNNSNTGIYTDNSNNIQIIDNQIYNSSFLGVYTYESHHSSMTGNDIWGNGWGLNPFASGIYVDFSNDSLIENNQIWNNTYTGIYIDDSEHVEISRNHIFNSTDYGIYGEVDAFHQYLTIQENVIHDNGISGMLLEGYDDSIIAHNQIYNHADSGLDFYGARNEVIGNEVYNCETGINSHECENNTFSENVVYLCIDGIYIMNVGSNVIDNIVFDNEYGIYMDFSGNCSIYGNDIGWNTMNAYERFTFPDMPLMWYNNITEVGNWWHNYNYTGFYNITTESGIDSQDLFPSRSLDLGQPVSIEYEILETGNVIEWDAYALNPSHYEVVVDGSSVLVEDWDGGNIEFLADGLSHGTHTIEVAVFHISGHSLGNDITADVEDLTPPSTIEGLILIEIVVGDEISTLYISYDPSGIEWAINDTSNFAISPTGLLTNLVDLPIGEYAVRITASDPYGHSTAIDVTIMVSAAPGGIPTILILVMGTGVAIVVLVVVTIGYKRRGT